MHVHVPVAEKEEEDRGATARRGILLWEGAWNAEATEAAMPNTRTTLLQHGRRRRLVVRLWSCGWRGMVSLACCCCVLLEAKQGRGRTDLSCCVRQISWKESWAMGLAWNVCACLYREGGKRKRWSGTWSQGMQKGNEKRERGGALCLGAWARCKSESKHHDQEASAMPI